MHRLYFRKRACPASTQVDCNYCCRITSARMYAIIQENCTNHVPAIRIWLSCCCADFSTLAKLKTYVNGNEAMFRLAGNGPNADMPQVMAYPALSRATRDSIACWTGKGMPD